jgi:hypothetical protein
MFCPGCALEDRSNSQFCRACGTELYAVRTALQPSDAITASAVTARDEVGRAIAAKIRGLQSANDLKKVVENVLPQIEKFLESPEERRLRTAREGVLTAATGLGAMLFFVFLSSFAQNNRHETIAFVFAGLSFIVLLVGLGIIINARWLSVLTSGGTEPGRKFRRLITDEITTNSLHRELSTGPAADLPSVTEGTTRQLRNSQ